MFEVACSVLWSRRKPDGVNKLWADWLDMDIRWANDAIGVPRFKEAAEKKKRECEKELSSLGFDPARRSKEAPYVPNMCKMLLEIQQADEKQGAGPPPEGFQFLEYNIYRELSAYAHCNMTIVNPLTPREAVVNNVLAACIYSTWNLMRSLAGFQGINLEEREESLLDLFKGWQTASSEAAE